MGTYEASRIRKAAIDYKCADCGDVIKRGDRYLSYKPGLKTRRPICLNASGVESVKGCVSKRTAFGLLIYKCADMPKEIE
jgi:DNA-directed RNA polymerase subunit RPC12/RpoP